MTQLTPWIKDHGQGAYRVGQVRQVAVRQRARDFSEMTNLPQAIARRAGSRFRAVELHDRSAHAGRRRHRKAAAHAAPMAARSNACCFATKRAAPSASARRSAAAWAASSAPAASTALQRNLTTGEIVEQMLQLAVAARPRTSGSATSSSWAWASRSRISTRCSPPSTKRAAKTAWASAPGESRSPPSASPKRCGGWPKPTPRYRLAVSLHAPNDELRQTDRAGRRQDSDSPTSWPRPTTISICRAAS